MPKFDMNGTGGNTSACVSNWIDIDRIDPNPLNGEVYQVQDIEQLADDIAINGLLQAPLVQDMHNGRYQLISGHRRCAALNLLVKRGEVQFRKVLCSVDNDSDEISIGLKLIAANQNVRQKNNGEILAEAEKYIQLMSERKKQEKLQGRVRDMVAKQLDISSASLAELLAIGKNLTEPLLTWFKRNQITKSVAVEISKCAKDTQLEIANMIVRGKEFTVKDVKQCREALEVEENAENESTEITPDGEDYQTDETEHIEEKMESEYSTEPQIDDIDRDAGVGESVDSGEEIGEEVETFKESSEDRADTTSSDSITETGRVEQHWTPDEVENVLTWAGNIKAFCKEHCKRDEYEDFQCDCPFIRAHHGYITCILTGDDEYAPEDWNYE